MGTERQQRDFELLDFLLANLIEDINDLETADRDISVGRVYWLPSYLEDIVSINDRMDTGEVLDGLKNAINELIPKFKNLMNLNERHLLNGAVKNIVLSLDVCMVRSKNLSSSHFTNELKKVEKFIKNIL